MKIALSLLSGGIVNRGAEHSMLMLAEDLSSLGHQVTVFQPGGVPSGTPAFKICTVKLPFSPTSHKPTTFVGKVLERLYLNSRGLLTLIFSFQVMFQLKSFDIVIPTDGFWSVIAAKWGKQRHAKIVCVGLAGIGWTDRNTLRLHPDIFVSLSSKAAQWAKAIYPQGNIVTIPLQVDLDIFKQSSPLALPFHQPIVLTVAALTKYKRVDVIVRAVAEIPNCILLIIGQGEELNRITTLCNKLVPNRFLIKAVDFAAMPQIYKTASVFAFVSDTQEAFGQVLVEAMAAELPIVTTSDPIRQEIVGEQGVYVNPNEPTSVIEGIKKGLAQGKTQYAMYRFDRREIAKKYEQVCQS